MKFYIILFVLLIALTSVNASLYVATGKQLMYSSDESTFNEIYNITSYQTYGTYIYPTQFGTPIGLTYVGTNITNIAVSGDGQYIYLLARNVSNIWLLESDDFGVTFNPHTGMFSGDPFLNFTEPLVNLANPLSLEISSTGAIVIINYNNGTGYYRLRSSNYGNSFTKSVSGANGINNVVMSDDGKYMLQSYYNTNYNAVYKSSDYGVTFSLQNIELVNGQNPICTQQGISTDGKYQYCLSNYGVEKFIYSNDYGSTWENNTQASGGVLGYILPNSVRGKNNTNNVAFRLSTTILYTGNFTNLTSRTVTAGNYIISDYDNTRLWYMENIGNKLIRIDNNDFTTQTIVKSFTNGITGMFYTSELTIPTTPACVDENTYCSTPFYNYLGEIQCYKNDTYNCAQGCDNTTTPITCTNLCTNECNIIGSRECTSSVEYSVCEDSNGDGCFEKNEGYICSSGSYCQNAFYYAFCTALNFTGITNPTGFSITPYTVNDANTSYVNDPITRQLSVKGAFSTHTQLFYTTGTGFSSRTCDYKESNIYTKNSLSIINASTDYIIPTTASTTQININVIPQDNIDNEIKITSSLGGVMSDLRLYRNVTGQYSCLRYVNNTNLVCDYSYVGYEDLKNILLTYNFDFNSDTYSMKIIFNRTTSVEYLLDVQGFVGADLSNININSTNMTLNYFNVATITQPTAMTPINNNNLLYLPCDYSATGIYKVRTYHAINGNPVYNDYKDYIINVQALGLGLNGVESAQQGQDGLTEKQKLIYSLLIILAVILLVGTPFAFSGDSKTIMVGGMVGIFGGIVTSIILSLDIINMLPSWVALIFALIGAIFIAIIFKIVFFSTGD